MKGWKWVGALALVGLGLRAEGTVLTFEGQGTNVPLQTFGSHASGPSVGLQQGNGYTPNVGVSYRPDGANGFQAYNDSVWNAAQLDGSPAGGAFDIVFAPDAGYGVRVNSFRFVDYPDYAAGHRFGWQLLDAGNGVLHSGSNVNVPAGQSVTVSTGMTAPYAGPLTLRIVPDVSADVTDSQFDRALDDVSFDQAVVPEPGLAGVAAGLLVGLLAGRRRRGAAAN